MQPHVRNKQVVERVAEGTGWVKSRTADILGISRPTLDCWIEDLDIAWPQKGARPRFERTKSQEETRQQRRALHVKLPSETIDWLWHRAIDKRMPASRIVEEALQLLKERVRTADRDRSPHLEEI
jgi:Bacterial regulatory protein, Fis family